MRLLAIIANFGLVGFTVYVVVFSHEGPDAGGVWGMLALLLIAPILSLAALFTSPESKSLLALILKRKTLEEQKKIDELQKSKDAS